MNWNRNTVQKTKSEVGTIQGKGSFFHEFPDKDSATGWEKAIDKPFAKNITM